MSETLQCHEVRELLETAIDRADGGFVKLDIQTAIKIAEYIEAHQEPVREVELLWEYINRLLIEHGGGEVPTPRE